MKNLIKTTIFFSAAVIAILFLKINDQNVYAANGQRLPKDVNNDGVVDVFDIMAIRNHILGISKLTGDDLAAADVNQDGEIDIFDIVAIQNLILFHTHQPGDWEVDGSGNHIKKCTICGEVVVNEGPYSGWYTDRQGIKYYYTDGNKATGWTTIDSRKYYFDSNGVKSSMLGVDVSKYQEDIDWNQVKNDGIEFAMIRVGYGDDEPGQDDAYALSNMQKCEELGIPYGVYLYSYATSNEHLDSEVRHTLRMINGRNPSLGVFFDVEDTKYYNANGFPPKSNGDTLTQFAISFYEQIRNNGYESGVYANLDYYYNILNLSRLQGIPKWLATWGSDSMPEGDWGIWQYTNKGSARGIAGRVDMNALIIKK